MFSGTELRKGKQAPPVYVTSGGVALVLDHTYRLGFSGKKGVNEDSGDAVLCPGSAGLEQRTELCSPLWGWG